MVSYSNAYCLFVVGRRGELTSRQHPLSVYLHSVTHSFSASSRRFSQDLTNSRVNANEVAISGVQSILLFNHVLLEL